MSVNMIKQDNLAKNFNAKAKLLNIGLDKQVESLNKIYEGKIKFRVGEGIYGPSCICICSMDETVRILELPECEDLDFGYLFDYTVGKNLSSLKFPKCMPSIPFNELHVPYGIERIFAWDDKITNIDKRINKNNIKMLIMQYSNGKKPVVYRF